MGKLCNKKVIAASLLEWTLGSKTTFAKDENQELADKAKKIGIDLPSPDLAAFETIYCEVDKYNLNGVKVSKKAAEKGITTLIGKQINWNHEGAHQICGYIIDAFIKEDKIYIDGILFKSLFTEEFGTVVDLFESGKLFVSFELWNKKEDGTSIVKDCGDGYRELTEFVAHGCALLLLDQETGKPIPPACPRAQVQKLLAAVKVIEEAEIIVEKIFEKDERLVYAELAATEEQEPCTKCKTCTCHGEGGKENIMLEEIKNETILPEVKPEETAQVVVEEPKVEATVVEPIIEPAVVETVTVVEPIIEEKPVEATIETPLEIKVEEPKIEETAQVIPEPAQVTEPAPIVEQKPDEQAQVVIEPVETNPEEANVRVTKTEELVVVDTTLPNKEVIRTDLIQETVMVNNDGKEVVHEVRETVEVKTYTYEEVQSQVAIAKSEVEAKLAEKEIEITNLKKELDSKNQEIAELKTPKVEIAKEVVEEQPDLTVGNAETKTLDKYVARRKKINIKAYGHENKGY